MSTNTPVTYTITNLNIPAGDNFLPNNGVAIPVGYTALSVIMQLDNWSTSENIFVFANYSTDGGTTWVDEGGVETNGGPHLDHAGNPGTGFTCGVPDGSGVLLRSHTIVPSRHRLNGVITLT